VRRDNMKVKELRKLLVNMPADWNVMISGDQEGNNISPLEDVERMKWVDMDDAVYDMNDEDVDEDFEKVIVLWP